MNFAAFQRDYAARLNQLLPQFLPAPTSEPTILNQAMTYSLTAGGKRVRPLLCYATALALEVDLALIDPLAVALEMVHTYSLIHDDLPAMDDDDWRRGKPTCHQQFNEASAILAGDALLTLAFEILSKPSALGADKQLKMIEVLSFGAGAHGMVKGQQLDISAEGQTLTLPELQTIHRHKTGALIRAAVEIAALTTIDKLDPRYQQLCLYADCVGLAFQIQDDVLDVTASTEVLGKTQGADAAHNKATYTHLLGLEGARAAAQELCTQATAALADFDDNAAALRALAAYIVSRKF